jgi:ankyrin repeat protein
MPDRTLPDRPNLEQYKTQAKDLVRDCRSGSPQALARFHAHHPDHTRAPVSLTAAELVIAREHGFESWPKFAAHIETLRIQRAVESLADPVAGFLTAATVPRDGSNHASGTLEEAEAILSQFAHVGGADIYTAAVLGDEPAVRAFLSSDLKLATAPGGPYAWDALTYLCFSRYLRIDRDRSDAFVRTAQALLDAGASPNTGWTEKWQGKPEFESVIYGAAGAAHHPGMTRLLLEYGANPNDGETCYHAPETYDNTVTQILLESGKLNDRSRTWILVRKADWHDYNGIKLALDNGADPNAIPQWGNSALQHAVQRDNRLEIISLLLDRGADPLLGNGRDGRSAAVMAARRGRGDILALLRERGVDPQFEGFDRLIAACALADQPAIQSLTNHEQSLLQELLSEGGTLLAQFAGVGNKEGVRCLLNLGVPVDALYAGDLYFDIANDSTALHAAAWRGWPQTTKLLLERGANVNALDGKGRTPLQRAILACVDSFWKDRRSPEWIAPLLEAGATLDGIELPCGYKEADELLMRTVRSSELK